MSGQPWSIRSVLTLSVLLGVSSVSAGDPERVSVQILFSPQGLSYQQHAVTVEGVIQDLQVFSPFDRTNGRSAPARCLLDGRAAFLLDDETRIVPVEVLGSCHPHVADVLPHDGDHVRITGLVQVLTSEAPRHVRIQATTIQILEPTP